METNGAPGQGRDLKGLVYADTFTIHGYFWLVHVDRVEQTQLPRS